MARTKVRARYVHDREGFTEFACSDQMAKPLIEAGHDVRRIAEATAPRSKGDGDHYADHFKVDEEAGVIKIGKFLRRIVTVVNEHPAAAPNEFGGYRNKALHPLGRAGALVGDFRGKLPDD
jgi:hypothetical protein